MKKRRENVELKLVEDRVKKQQVRHARKKGLFKKALEYATYGDHICLQIRDEYINSLEEGLEAGPTAAPDTATPASSTGGPGSTPEREEKAGCSNALLSPKAVQVRDHKAQTKEAGVQWLLMEAVPNSLEGDKFCRSCGSRYDTDTRKEQELWLGCDNDNCDYWVHAKCLLGKSTKITPMFCSGLPYLCPFHRG